jgi:hypothetical protein
MYRHTAREPNRRDCLSAAVCSDLFLANIDDDFATRYTAAWCSQHAASVASFFEEQGSLKINDGTQAVGRASITNSAQSFMTAFPDIVVKMDRIVVMGGQDQVLLDVDRD